MPVDVLPRRVVDYQNAHLYIDPDNPHVQTLLRSDVFPEGVPVDPQSIVSGVHSFMAQSTQYVADEEYDEWASVGDVAQNLTGDCEDLSNLEHSLLLAAFNQQGISNHQLQSHAAYVHYDNRRLGHVYKTLEINGDTFVLDPSLEPGLVGPLSEYQKNIMLMMFLLIMLNTLMFLTHVL